MRERIKQPLVYPKWFKILTSSMVGLILAALFLYGSRFFWKVQKINCWQDTRPCYEDVQAILERNLLDRPLLMSNLELVIRVIPELWGQIQDVKLSKELPSTLNVNLTSPNQLYVVEYAGTQWQMNELEQWRKLNYQVDENKNLVVILNNESLGQKIAQGERLPIFYHYALTQLRQYLLSWPEMMAQVKQIEITPDEELTLTLSNDLKLIFDQTDLIDSWQKWRYIWQALDTRQKEEFSQIDLRFKSPVATPKNSGQVTLENN